MFRFFRTFLLSAALMLAFGSALPALADDHCWCRLPAGAGATAGTCEHHTQNASGAGIVCGSTGDTSCTSYCASRGWTAAYCDAGTYLNRSGVGDAPTGVAGTCPSAPAAATTPDTSATPTVTQLYNPLGDITIPDFISRGIQAVVGIIGALALLMMVAGGVIWMTAGDSDRVKTAKNMIVNSAIGLLLIFFSYTIIAIFFSILRA